MDNAMDLQVAFNIAVALAGFLGGWVLNSLRSSIDSLQKADDALTESICASIHTAEVIAAYEAA